LAVHFSGCGGDEFALNFLNRVTDKAANDLVSGE
jgi:hypothetical protein